MQVELSELASADLGDLITLIQSQRVKHDQLVCIVYNVMQRVKLLEDARANNA